VREKLEGLSKEELVELVLALYKHFQILKDMISYGLKDLIAGERE
jgi:hypothetical protein